MNCTRRQHQYARYPYHSPHHQHDFLVSVSVDDHTLQTLSRQTRSPAQAHSELEKAQFIKLEIAKFAKLVKETGTKID